MKKATDADYAQIQELAKQALAAQTEPERHAVVVRAFTLVADLLLRDPDFRAELEKVAAGDRGVLKELLG